MAEFLDAMTSEEVGFGAVLALCQPMTKAGQRLKKSLRPFLPKEQPQWQEAMEDLRVLCAAADDANWRKGVLEALRDLPDVAGLLVLLRQGASLRQVDFFEVKSFLWHGLALQRLLVEKGLSFAWWPEVEWEALLLVLNSAGPIVPTFSLAEFPDARLQTLRQELAQVEAAIFAVKKEQSDRLRARYQKAPNRAGEYVWDRKERTFLELAATDAELLLLQENAFEAVYQVVEPGPVTRLRQEKEQLRHQLDDVEVEVLLRLAEELRPQVQSLQAAQEALARLDWTFAKEQLARQWQVTPTAAVWLLAEELPWQVRGGWHPVVRQAVEQRGGKYTRLELEILPGVGVITGPNMGGKTIVLKTFGLLQALAQHALPVPAERFEFHPVERIGVSGGDAQSMVSGLSSFGAEMQRLRDLLNTRGRALLLLDEVARTTNPQEGEALATALATFLQTTRHTALFATHFPKVTQVGGCQKFRIAGLSREVLDELEQAAFAGDVLAKLQGAMDYRLFKSDGTDVPHDAVRLAACFGLPEVVLKITRETLEKEQERRVDVKGGARTS